MVIGKLLKIRGSQFNDLSFLHYSLVVGVISFITWFLTQSALSIYFGEYDFWKVFFAALLSGLAFGIIFPIVLYDR